MTGKIWADDDVENDTSYLDCRLDTGSAQYRDRSIVSDDEDYWNDVTLVITGVARFTAPAHASVICKDSWGGNSSGDSGMVWNTVRITAVKAGHLVDSQL